MKKSVEETKENLKPKNNKNNKNNKLRN